MINGYRINEKYRVLEQIDKSDRICYSDGYVDKNYDQYQTRCDMMSHLRFGWILSRINPKSILDVGYGNGSFLKLANSVGIDCTGFDISGFDISPIKTTTSLDGEYDLITFFDSLEHFDDIGFVKDLKCSYIVITIPHLNSYEDSYFSNWKHRKPGEHFWHFDKNSLIQFMNDMGFSLITIGSVEDVIRKSSESPNTVTAIFRRNNG